MKRYNHVNLMGTLKVEGVRLVPFDGNSALSVHCICKTDTKHIGGCHPVVAYDGLARLVLSFASVSLFEEQPLDVCVSGYLWSREQFGTNISTTIAEDITFFAAPAFRAQAVQINAQLLEGSLSVLAPALVNMIAVAENSIEVTSMEEMVYQR